MAARTVSSALKALKDPSLFRQSCFIGGEWVNQATQKTFQVTDPATGGVFGTTPNMGKEETSEAIRAAKQAFPSWKATPAAERSAILMRWRDLMLDNTDDLATLMTIEQGKPLAEAKGEIAYAAAFLELFSEESKRVFGDVMKFPTSRVLVTREPVGVIGAITPWNFPSAMITRKLGAALAAGCTSVVKPSEFTPYSAFALCELATRAGVPAGVVNCLTGDAAAIGEELCRSKDVRKITFTGSTRVGKLLMRQSGDTIKRLSLELGGNAPFIVFDDADIDAAIQGLLMCKFRNAGQTCVTANRVFVQAGVYDEFSSKLASAVAGLRVGNGLAEGITVGPLINADAVRKVEGLVEDARTNGGEILVGGSAPKLEDGCDPALFYAPTVIANASSAMRLSREEAFGPVAPLFKFDTEEEVICRANDTDAGLAAYFYTRCSGRQWRVSEGLEYGMVAVNQPLVSVPAAPFGGVKESGMGREGSYLGIEEYLSVKATHMAL